MLVSSFNQTPSIEKSAAGTSGDDAAFGVREKSGTIAENEGLIPHASAHANKNDNSMGVKLVVKLITIEQGGFTNGGQTVEFKAFENYFATSDSVQHSRRYVEILDKIMLAATNDGPNFTLEEVDELITIDYCSDVLMYIRIFLLIYIWDILGLWQTSKLTTHSKNRTVLAQSLAKYK